MIRPLLALVLLASPLVAQEAVFPGLRSILTVSEWERSGLSQLTPEQINIIDQAMRRYHTIIPPPAPPAGTQPVRERSVLEAFGLPSFGGDWQSIPPLRAQVVRWRGGNRFVLDNGQVWEGLQSIPYELPGKNVTIAARRGGSYVLIVEDQNTAIRVIRLE
jgi:hypothetical protein